MAENQNTSETALEKLSRSFAADREHYDDQFWGVLDEMRNGQFIELFEAAKKQFEAGATSEELQKFVEQGMRLIAESEARTLIGVNSTPEKILVELYEHLAENTVEPFAPSGYGTAWHVFPTDDGGWVEFDPDEVKAAFTTACGMKMEFDRDAWEAAAP